MGSIKKIVAPAYQRIAVDIANSIADGKYTVGQRISGRTTLASHYGVSPETIRKAVCILQDVGVLSVTQGSGIEILSLENTIEFIDKLGLNNSNQYLKNLKLFLRRISEIIYS